MKLSGKKAPGGKSPDDGKAPGGKSPDDGKAPGCKAPVEMSLYAIISGNKFVGNGS
jgi:hypothetical protein